MKKISFESLSNQELLELQNSVKTELKKRSAIILLDYLKDYTSTRVDSSGMVDLAELHKAVKNDMEMNEDDFRENVDILKAQKKMYLSLVPGRQITQVKFFFFT